MGRHTCPSWVELSLLGREHFLLVSPGKTLRHQRKHELSGAGCTLCLDKQRLPLEPDTGYSKFTAYTLLNHGGDFNAAAKQLASEQRNQPVVWSTGEEVDGVSRMVTDHPGDSYDCPFVRGSFVWDFADYCRRQTDAPAEFIEAAGLVGVSVATQGARGRLRPFPNGLATNLYTILVGPTTRSRKSTVQGFLTDLTKQAFPFSRLPDKETPERFTQTLADRSGNATLWAPDELGISLAEMYARDFMGGLEGVLLTVYGGEDYTYQRASGNPITIRNPIYQSSGHRHQKRWLVVVRLL